MLRGGLRSAPGAVRGKSFVRMGIELAGVGVVLNRGVKLPCLAGPRSGHAALAACSGPAVSIALIYMSSSVSRSSRSS